MNSRAEASPARPLRGDRTHSKLGSSSKTDWSTFDHWDLLLPPNRPGGTVLRRTEAIIRRHGRVQTAAVLGSTPEYLDLLARLGIPEIVCLEASSDFHAKMAASRRFPHAETLIEGDWLTSLAGLVGEFDVIVSDFTLGNLTYEAQEEFLPLIANSLARDGLFIDRVLTHRQDCYEYEALARKFRLLPANLVTVNDFNARWVFCGARVQDIQQVDATETYDWSARAFDEPELHWLLAKCELITPRGAIWYYGRPWRLLKRLYGDVFEIISESPEPRHSAYYGWAFLIESKARAKGRR